MANRFWSSIRKVEHPNYDIKTGKFICPCGKSFTEINAHADHVTTEHSQEFAYENIPGRIYDRVYKTDRYLAKKEKSKAERRVTVFMTSKGYKKIAIPGVGVLFSKPNIQGGMSILTKQEAEKLYKANTK